MDLSIIVTSYKNPKLLKVCLDSIRKSSLDISYEIIVSDGETQEDTEIMMREDYADILFFSFTKNVGFQALLKKAIDNAKGDYILLLNGDIVVNENSIQQLFEYIKENKDVGIVGPKLLNFNGSTQDSCFRFYKPITIVYRRTFLGKFSFAKKHLNWFLMKDYDHKNIKEVDWLMGSALMVPKVALERVGFMDTRFFMYMEDVDWCRRFWENNYKVIYYPFSSMYHYHGKTSGNSSVLKSLLFNKYTWIHIKSAFMYFKKYCGKEIPKHN